MTGILNSPNSWLFDEDDLRHTPSRADGISYEREMYERAFGVDLIVRVGAVRVDVPLLTIATASIFLHRFYMLESLKKYKAREVALACLFLAGKVEESLRKVETVVNYCLRLEDRRKGKEPDVHPSSEKLKTLVQQVLFVEEVVLVALQFDLTVVHPHPLLTRALKAQNLNMHQKSSLGRAAWQILSDIYTTPLCICYEPETLAAASLLLAYSLLNDILPSLPPNWTDHFDIDWQDEEDVHEVDVVMQRVLDLWAHARNDKIKQAGNDLKQVTPKASSFLKAKPVAVQESKDTDETKQDETQDMTMEDPASSSNVVNADVLQAAEQSATESSQANQLAAPSESMTQGTSSQVAEEKTNDVEMESVSPTKDYEQPPTPG